jgi:hypothetical protein
MKKPKKDWSVIVILLLNSNSKQEEKILSKIKIKAK